MTDDYQTGLIRKKPMQRDMFTGNLVKTKPKSGRGDHIVLKDDGLGLVKVPGMAHFSGSGPKGKRCSDCQHLGDLPCFGRKRQLTREGAGLKEDTNPRRIEENACRKAAEMYEGVVQIGGINHELACKYFEPRT